MPTLHSSLTPLRLLPRLRSFHVGPDARRLVSSSSACSFPSSNLLPTSIWVGCLRRHRPPSVSSFTSSFSSSAKDSFSKLPMPPSYFWAHSHEDTPPLSVGVYQGPTVVGGLEAALQHMHDIASRAQAQGTQLLCFPELFFRGYDIPDEALRKSSIHQKGSTMKRLQDMARSLNMALCFGYAEREGDDFDDQYSGPLFNSAVCLDSDGSIAGHYRKSHLWQSEERRRFTEGHELLEPFTLKGHEAHKFSMLICYDIEYPEPARLATLRGTSVLLVLTALADSGTPDLIPTCLVPARALENHVWICYANLGGRREEDKADPEDRNAVVPFRGQSAIIGPDGFELARATSSRCLLLADVKPRKYDVLSFHSTPYLVDRRPGLYAGLEAAEHIPDGYQRMASEEQKKEIERLHEKDKEPPKGRVIPLD